MPDVPRGPRRALKGLEIDPRSGSHGHGVRRLDARHAGALHRGALDLPEHVGGCRAPEESSALAESALFRGLPRIPRQELSERKAFLVVPRPFWQLSPHFLTELPGMCGPTSVRSSGRSLNARVSGDHRVERPKCTGPPSSGPCPKNRL